MAYSSRSFHPDLFYEDNNQQQQSSSAKRKFSLNTSGNYRDDEITMASTMANSGSGSGGGDRGKGRLRLSNPNELRTVNKLVFPGRPSPSNASIRSGGSSQYSYSSQFQDSDSQSRRVKNIEGESDEEMDHDQREGDDEVDELESDAESIHRFKVPPPSTRGLDQSLDGAEGSGTINLILQDEEDDETDAQVKKRSRTLTTAHQTSVLTALFAKSRFPSTETREEVGLALGMSGRRVQIWLQNRRQAQKRAKEGDVAESSESGTAPIDRHDSATPRPMSISSSHLDPNAARGDASNHSRQATSSTSSMHTLNTLSSTATATPHTRNGFNPNPNPNSASFRNGNANVPLNQYRLPSISLNSPSLTSSKMQEHQSRPAHQQHYRERNDSVSTVASNYNEPLDRHQRNTSNSSVLTSSTRMNIPYLPLSNPISSPGNPSLHHINDFMIRPPDVNARPREDNRDTNAGGQRVRRQGSDESNGRHVEDFSRLRISSNSNSMSRQTSDYRNERDRRNDDRGDEDVLDQAMNTMRRSSKVVLPTRGSLPFRHSPVSTPYYPSESRQNQIHLSGPVFPSPARPDKRFISLPPIKTIYDSLPPLPSRYVSSISRPDPLQQRRQPEQQQQQQQEQQQRQSNDRIRYDDKPLEGRTSVASSSSSATSNTNSHALSVDSLATSNSIHQQQQQQQQRQSSTNSVQSQQSHDQRPRFLSNMSNSSNYSASGTKRPTLPSLAESLAPDQRYNSNSSSGPTQSSTQPLNYTKSRAQDQDRRDSNASVDTMRTTIDHGEEDEHTARLSEYRRLSTQHLIQQETQQRRRNDQQPHYTSNERGGDPRDSQMSNYSRSDSRNETRNRSRTDMRNDEGNDDMNDVEMRRSERETSTGSSQTSWNSAQQSVSPMTPHSPRASHQDYFTPTNDVPVVRRQDSGGENLGRRSSASSGKGFSLSYGQSNGVTAR